MADLLRSFIPYILYMVPGFFLIGLVILIHETGHFLAAKILGVSVETFGVGIGPVIWRYWGKNTEFRLSIIPFGGYCKLAGSEDLTLALQKGEKSIKYASQGSYFAIHPVKKFIIYLSGPLFNLAAAFLMMTAVSSIAVERLSHPLTVAPQSDYPALYADAPAVADIRKGDRIVSSGSIVFSDWEDFAGFISAHKGEDIPLTLERDGVPYMTVLHPYGSGDSVTYGITNIERSIIGRSERDDIHPLDIVVEANGREIVWAEDLMAMDDTSFSLVIIRDGERIALDIPSRSFPFAWNTAMAVSPDSDTPFRTALDKTLSLLSRTTIAIMKLVAFRFSEALTVVSGPFSSASGMGRITTLAMGVSFSSGVRTVLYLLAIVSVSLAVGNMIPIPSFDGGALLICLFEMLIGRPLKPRTYLVLHIGGVCAAWIIIILMNAWGFLGK